LSDHARAVFCSDTEELVEALKLIAGVPIGLLPLPLAIESPASEERGARAPCVAYLGHASLLKGFNLLPGIIARFLEPQPKARFVIQSYGNTDDYRMPIEKALRAIPDDLVRVVTGTISRAAYLQLLHEADIVLMPYAKEFYGWASSGIFIEALALGKVVVIPEGTWLARQGARFKAGGKVFAALNVDDVANCLRATLADLPRLSAQAKAAMPAWVAVHSPRNFVDQLLAVSRSRTEG
jgi:glycosyltransferase involved in cell wall biosynthesis